MDSASPPTRRAASRSGSPSPHAGTRAQYLLGCAYDIGEGVPLDRAAAPPLFEQAARADLDVAIHALGLYHAAGEVVPRDPARAAALFRRAADMGYAPSQFELATLYASGDGVARSDAQALSWYDLAIEGAESEEERAEYEAARAEVAERAGRA